MIVEDRKKYKEILKKCDGDEKMAMDMYIQFKCLTDLYFLGTEIFGWGTARDKKNPKRKRVDPKFHRWLAKCIQLEGDKLIMVPRLHLKSTWVKAEIVRQILNDPNIRIGLFSVSSRLVEQELGEIKNLLSTPLLRRYFPDIITDPGKDYRNWEKCTGSMLTVRRDKTRRVPQEPQVMALGSGARIAGIHIDIAFVDDIVSPETVTTAEQMKKTEDWWAYIQSILELGGDVTMTGTFYHMNDLYNKIIREKQFKNIFLRRAIENDKILYSSWFTKKDLEKIKRRQGHYIFSCQYMLEPMPMEDRVFPSNPSIFHELPKDKGGYKFYIAVDPAATTRSYSDQTGIVIAAVNKLKQVWIVEAIGVKKTGEEIARLLVKKCLQYKPVRVGIELGLQTHLKSIIERTKDDYELNHHVEVPLRIEPIPVSREKSKRDRVALTMGAFVRQAAMFIHSDCTDLLHQMAMFTGKGKEKDDLVDAASMIFYVVEDFSYQYWVAPQGFKNPDMHTYHSIFEKKKKGKGWRDNFVA